jgi:hypothetical protein
LKSKLYLTHFSILCSVGYRIPTAAELEAERQAFPNNATGVLLALKLPLGAYRSCSVGSNGNYWSSSVSNHKARSLDFGNSSANMNDNGRAGGLSVPCIEE